MLLISLYIKIAFWYVTLSGNVCQSSSLNSSEDGVYKSQSKITRAHSFGILQVYFQCRTTVTTVSTIRINKNYTFY